MNEESGKKKGIQKLEEITPMAFNHLEGEFCRYNKETIASCEEKKGLDYTLPIPLRFTTILGEDKGSLIVIICLELNLKLEIEN